jgi:hypothetical protein
VQHRRRIDGVTPMGALGEIAVALDAWRASR